VSHKTALIIGEATPVNRAIALALASEDFQIVLAYQDEAQAAQALVQEMELADFPCRIVHTLLNSPEAAEQATQQIQAEQGELQLMVWNAGLALAGGLIDIEAERLDLLYERNYRSALLAAKVSANAMIHAGSAGSIVLLTSLHGIRAYTSNLLVGSYAAALHRSTESLAMQLAPHRIRINCVAPSETASSTAVNTHFPESERIPLGRGLPEDIAQAVLYLGTDKARYTTGVTLKIDGGLSLPGMPEHGKGIGWNSPMPAPGLIHLIDQADFLK
jgi:glucose 1-dehydrogenase